MIVHANFFRTDDNTEPVRVASVTECCSAIVRNGVLLPALDAAAKLRGEANHQPGRIRSAQHHPTRPPPNPKRPPVGEPVTVLEVPGCFSKG